MSGGAQYVVAAYAVIWFLLLAYVVPQFVPIFKDLNVELPLITEVILLVGSQEGTAHLPLAVLEPGDRAVLLDPGYPSHRGGLHLASATLEPLRLQASAGCSRTVTRSAWAMWSTCNFAARCAARPGSAAFWPIQYDEASGN